MSRQQHTRREARPRLAHGWVCPWEGRVPAGFVHGRAVSRLGLSMGGPCPGWVCPWEGRVPARFVHGRAVSRLGLSMGGPCPGWVCPWEGRAPAGFVHGRAVSRLGLSMGGTCSGWVCPWEGRTPAGFVVQLHVINMCYGRRWRFDCGRSGRCVWATRANSRIRISFNFLLLGVDSVA